MSFLRSEELADSRFSLSDTLLFADTDLRCAISSESSFVEALFDFRGTLRDGTSDWSVLIHCLNGSWLIGVDADWDGVTTVEEPCRIAGPLWLRLEGAGRLTGDSSLSP